MTSSQSALLFNMVFSPLQCEAYLSFVDYIHGWWALITTEAVISTESWTLTHIHGSL